MTTESIAPSPATSPALHRGVTPSRAHLDRPSNGRRRDLTEAKRRVSASATSGPSVARLAGALTAELAAVKPNRMRRLVLTSKSGDRGRVTAALASLADQVTARWGGRVGMLTTLDVSPKNRAHANVLVLVGEDFSARDVAASIVTSWCRLAPGGGARSAQRNRGVRDHRDLEHHVFVHDLAAAGRVAAPLAERVALVGPLAERVRAVGTLEKIWRVVATALRVPEVDPPEVEQAASRERRSPLWSAVAGPGGRCAWCLERIASNARDDRRWCDDGHQRSACNALARETKQLGRWVKAFVAERERSGWSRPEALRAARAASVDAMDCEFLGLVVGADFVVWTLDREVFARCACGCGEPLGVDVSARTSADRCRARLARRRKGDERIRAAVASEHPAWGVVAGLDHGGRRDLAMRAARMILRDGPVLSPRLYARQAKLLDQLSLTPQTMNTLCSRARLRMTSTDRAETIAAWLIGGAVEVSGRRGGELRLRLSFCTGIHLAGLIDDDR